MEGQNRSAVACLNQLLAEPDKLYAQGFTVLLRYLDANSGSEHPIGRTISPKQDVVRLGQTALLKFYPAAFTSIEHSPVLNQYKLKNSYFGLFGINGPLPIHMTEYAIERTEQCGDPTLVDFADIFHHRFISLFYRAWSEAEPVVDLDRSKGNNFLHKVNCLSGVEYCTHPEEFNYNNSFKQSLTGLFSLKHRSKGALTQILSQLTRLPVKLNEFFGKWYPIECSEISRLGRCTSKLGRNTIIGARTFQRAYAFSIKIGPLDYKEYLSFFEQPDWFNKVFSCARAFVGCEYDFSIELYLNSFQKKESKLGQVRLGYTSWIQSKEAYKKQEEPILAYHKHDK